MMVGRGVRWAGAALVMFAALAACGRQTAGAAAQSYEIVTQTRPESQEAYMRVYRLAYDACARVRAIQNLPPPQPLVTLPADFVIKRSTYLSNGRDYLIRHEEFNVELDETDCKTSIGSNMTENVVGGGKVYGQRREPEWNAHRGVVRVEQFAVVQHLFSKCSSVDRCRQLSGRVPV